MLTGGGPWGFTLSGGKDFGSHLQILKVILVFNTNMYAFFFLTDGGLQFKLFQIFVTLFSRQTD